jgi:hypothetical protein
MDGRTVIAVLDLLGAKPSRLLYLLQCLCQFLVAHLQGDHLPGVAAHRILGPHAVRPLGPSVPGFHEQVLVGSDEGVVRVLLEQGVIGESLLRTLTFFRGVSRWVPGWSMLSSH